MIEIKHSFPFIIYFLLNYEKIIKDITAKKLKTLESSYNIVHQLKFQKYKKVI